MVPVRRLSLLYVVEKCVPIGKKNLTTTQTLLVLSLVYNLHFYFKLPKPFYLYKKLFVDFLFLI